MSDQFSSPAHGMHSNASSSQTSLKPRYFQYDPLPTYSIRLFKLDLNGEEEPLSGALMTTYFLWDLSDWGSDYMKSNWKHDSEDILKQLTGSRNYDTFSYTWGDTVELHPLQLSMISHNLGPEGTVRTNFEPYRNGTIQITTNLKDLLMELRRRRHANFVWIDAICINQANDLEKREQIPLMGKIYEFAGHGYIWLGKGTHEQIEAMKQLDQVAGKLENVHHRGDVLRPQNREAFFQSFLPPPESDIWLGLRKIMGSSYWNRLWTLQEAVISDKLQPPKEVLLGEATVKLETIDKFSIAATRLSLRSWITTGEFGLRPLSFGGFDGLDEIRTCRESYTSEFHGVNLRALLLGTRRRKATIPADVIYGMLAMMDQHTAKVLQPSSTSSTQDVFLKFAKLYIRNEHKEHLLNHVATEERLEGLPSWCPNFASSPATFSLGSTWTGKYKYITDEMEGQRYHAGFNKKGKWKLPRSKLYMLKAMTNLFTGRNPHVGTRDTDDPHQITLMPNSDCILISGMHIDLVVDTVNVMPLTSSADFFSLSSLTQLEEWDTTCLKLALKYLSRDVDGFDTYARTITANRVTVEEGSSEAIMFDHQHSLDFVDRYTKLRAFISNMKAVNGDMEIESNLDQETYHYADVLSRVTFGRKFFATEGGRIGLGPADLEVGDAVCVIFYCPTPYILRHGQTSRSRFIGEAYVHGLMYGEALEMLDNGKLDKTKWVVE